eukprot:1143247-Pelagomonas_calceolata.AAC.16
MQRKRRQGHGVTKNRAVYTAAADPAPRVFLGATQHTARAHRSRMQKEKRGGKELGKEEPCSSKAHSKNIRGLHAKGKEYGATA